MVSDVGLNAVEIAIFSRLNDASITATVPASQHYNSMVPPNGDYPAIVVQMVGYDRRAEAFNSDAGSLLYQIKCLTKGNYSPNIAGAMQAAIDALFEKGALAPTGWSVYALRRERYIRFLEYDEERVPIWHAGGQYRLWTVQS